MVRERGEVGCGRGREVSERRKMGEEEEKDEREGAEGEEKDKERGGEERRGGGYRG